LFTLSDGELGKPERRALLTVAVLAHADELAEPAPQLYELPDLCIDRR
jgi:hypothetical protein